MRKALLLGIAVALAFTGTAFAQETQSGTIAGQVLDPQGAAVPGATVTVISPQGDKTYTTDSQGQFVAPFLIPGMYDVRVELTGFKTIEQKGVMVRLGQRSRLTFTLAVSQVQETVEAQRERTDTIPIVAAGVVGAKLQAVMREPMSVDDEEFYVNVSIGMALYGLKPVAEIQFSGFIYQGFHQIEQHMARFTKKTSVDPTTLDPDRLITLQEPPKVEEIEEKKEEEKKPEPEKPAEPARQRSCSRRSSSRRCSTRSRISIVSTCSCRCSASTSR